LLWLKIFCELEDLKPEAMKYVFLALSSFLAIIAQMIAGDNFFLYNFLDLSLILVAYWAIYRSRMQALFVGSLAGLLLDAAMGWPLGYNGFGKTLAAVSAVLERFNTAEQLWVRFSIITTSSLAVPQYVPFVLVDATIASRISSALPTYAIIATSVAILVLRAGFLQKTQIHRLIELRCGTAGNPTDN
jgi:rod shape-determining protein MreD